MNLTPASSIDLPSEAILTRVSESGTRLMQTAIFMAEEKKPGSCRLATAQKSALILTRRCRGCAGVRNRCTGAPATVGFAANVPNVTYLRSSTFGTRTRNENRDSYDWS